MIAWKQTATARAASTCHSLSPAVIVLLSVSKPTPYPCQFQDNIDVTECYFYFIFLRKILRTTLRLNGAAFFKKLCTFNYCLIGAQHFLICFVFLGHLSCASETTVKAFCSSVHLLLILVVFLKSCFYCAFVVI